MNANKAKAALFAILLFGLGAAVGALGHRYYTANSSTVRNAEYFRSKYITEMQTRLKLNQHQIDQLQVILDETKAKFKAVRDIHHPEMVKINDEQIGKVKSILSPAQAKEYELMVAEREQQSKEQDERDKQDELHQREVHLKALAGH